ncbi:MAG: mechanosensitive ion channel family protein [Bacilli bacterium]
MLNFGNEGFFMSLLAVYVIPITITLVCIYVANSVGSKLISAFFKARNARMSDENRIRQSITLEKLSQNILKYVVYGIGLVMLLGMFINIGPLLASAGVLGLAIGFGAQGLVKDVVTGFFILFEDQYAVGDRVKMNGIEGNVIELGLRTTIIRGDNDERFFIANSSITQVCNLRDVKAEPDVSE